MRYKLIFLCLALFLLFPIISAQDLSLDFSINPHYYKNGVEIIPTPEIEYSAISFEIVGINKNTKSRILNLIIEDAYPMSFKKSLPLNITAELRILQEKTLWVSRLIPISEFGEGNVSFWFGVKGINEYNGEEIYKEYHSSIFIPKLEKELKEDGIFNKIGKEIWPSKPLYGIGVIFLLLFMGIFCVWKYEVIQKLGIWRDKSKKKRIFKKQYDEGWK